MAVIQLTAREFRENQAKVFDLLDAGGQVIINRGKKKSYTLVPFNAGLEVSKALQVEIDEALSDIAKKELVEFNDYDSIKEYFDRKRECIK